MDSKPQSPVRWAPRLVALLIPLVVLTAGAKALFSVPRKGVLSSARVISERLRARPPEVVLVGDSTAYSAVDEAFISEQTGLEFHSLARQGTGPAVWYAILEQRVFLAGYRPKLIIVAANLNSILRDPRRTGPKVFQDDRALFDQLENGHELIERKLFDSRRTRLEHRFWGNRIFLQDHLRGRLLTTFGSARSDQLRRPLHRELWRRTHGVPDFDWRAVAKEHISHDQALDHSLAQTFVVEWIELAESFDARILFLEVPVAPEYRERSFLGGALVREFFATLEGAGAGFVVFEEALDEGSYSDEVHFNSHGRKQFSARLATELIELESNPLPLVR